VLNDIFFRKTDGGRISYFNPADVEVKVDDKGNRVGAALKSDGQPVESGGIGTMSKSKNNGVDPQELIDHYGADIARFFMMFTSPPEQTLEWSDSGVEGAARFLRRLWSFCYEQREMVSFDRRLTKVDLSNAPEPIKRARRDVHMTLKQATYDMNRYQFNTVASAGMKVLNSLERLPMGVPVPVYASPGSPETQYLNYYTPFIVEGISILLRMLYPITPHISHYLWRELKLGEDILAASWPEPDPAALIEDEIELVVQVNGKKRADVRVPREADRLAIEKLVLANPSVQKYVNGQAVKKVVVVPGRLVNVVV